MKCDYRVIPLFKTHYSCGKSILTLEKLPDDKKKRYPTSVFDLLVEHKLSTLVIVDDNLSGLLEASKNCKDNKIDLMFGLRLSVTTDMKEKSEELLCKKSKYIIFAKNLEGYKRLIKIWSSASTEGFYYEPCSDFQKIKECWSDKDLKLCVPFYDSFIFKNSLESGCHVPDFSFTQPTFLLETNGLPFDDLMREKVKSFCLREGYNSQEAQSIFYKEKSDFLAYMTLRCINNKTTVEKPELQHMTSDEFNFEKWLLNK